jgi:hypothetical protein
MTLEAKIDLLLTKVETLEHRLLKQQTDLCDSKEACALIGVNNDRYLNYFYKSNLISRRKGGKGYLYFKSELIQLADKIKLGHIVLPTVKSIYQK